MKELVAKSKEETMPKNGPKAETKPKAAQKIFWDPKAKGKADAKAKPTPKPFHVDRTGGDWEVSNKVESWKTNEEKR